MIIRNIRSLAHTGLPRAVLICSHESSLTATSLCFASKHNHTPPLSVASLISDQIRFFRGMARSSLLGSSQHPLLSNAEHTALGVFASLHREHSSASQQFRSCTSSAATGNSKCSTIPQNGQTLEGVPIKVKAFYVGGSTGAESVWSSMCRKMGPGMSRSAQLVDLWH